jgi:hypothetical protein
MDALKGDSRGQACSILVRDEEYDNQEGGDSSFLGRGEEYDNRGGDCCIFFWDRCCGDTRLKSVLPLVSCDCPRDLRGDMRLSSALPSPESSCN